MPSRITLATSASGQTTVLEVEEDPKQLAPLLGGGMPPAKAKLSASGETVWLSPGWVVLIESAG